MPNATPTWVVDELLTLAVAEPTLGCRRYADRLADRGFAISRVDGAEASWSATGWAGAANASPRSPQLTAATTGLITEPALEATRSGSATSPPGPVTWSPWTASTSATSKASGQVWQLTAVDTATRWAIVDVVPRRPPTPTSRPGSWTR